MVNSTFSQVQKSLNPQLASAVGQFMQWNSQRLEALDCADKVTSPLYHYTSASGLKGIFEGGQLWFTDVLHANDPSEFEYGNNIAIDLLQNEAVRSSGDLKEFLEFISKMLGGALKNAVGVYVSSFSAVEDDLSQWRAYGDDGRGYAIAFAPSIFSADQCVNLKALNPNERTSIACVKYDDKEKKVGQAHHAPTIQKVIEVVKKVSDDGLLKDELQRQYFFKRLGVEFAIAHIFNSATLKHRAYCGEIETRLVIYNSSPTELRPYLKSRLRGSALVPYVPSPFPVKVPGNVLEIIVGPAAPERSEEAVKSLLNMVDLAKLNVRRSTIPYRSYAKT